VPASMCCAALSATKERLMGLKLVVPVWGYVLISMSDIDPQQVSIIDRRAGR
jgi:hypothetical protein